MAGIIWLASYPRSGNTWLRVLLTNYLRNTTEPADINALDGGPIASARVWFDEWCGVEASKLPAHIVDRLRPEVYRCLARADDTLYMKVHDAWCRVDTGEPMFPEDVTRLAVYIVRNPLDVAPSLANHLGVDVGTAAERMCDPTYGLGQRNSGQLDQHLGTWSDHVRSWVDHSSLPVHVVRYEDLRRDPVVAFGGVVRTAGLDYDPDRAAKAVAFSDFGLLQSQEAKTGFRERPSASSRFFRRGGVDAWRDDLPEALVARIVREHSETMERFGYEVPTSSPTP